VSIRVVNVKQDWSVLREATAVYIGRGNRWKGLRPSPLANRFIIGHDGDRGEVIAKYDAWLTERIYVAGDRDVLEEMKRLAATVVQTGRLELACFCHPLLCHGDIIKRELERALRAEDGA
jgi:hypothetical protein